MDYPHNITKVYGPYTRKNDGREVVRLRLDDGSFKMKSYARYLKEIELGRELHRDEETVDHVNRIHTDNDMDNTQLLSRSDNAKKSAVRRNDVIDSCVWCNTQFTLSVHQVRNRCRGKSGPFCSRSCVGKYTQALKSGEVQPFEANSIEVTYFRNDDGENNVDRM